MYSKIKYKIGRVQQLKLLQLNQSLEVRQEELIQQLVSEGKKPKLSKNLVFDSKDAEILTYMESLPTWVKKAKLVVDGETYYYMSYSKLIEYLPLLGISSDKVLGRRIAMYEEAGLIKRIIKKPINEAGQFLGTRTFICLTSDFYSLFEEYEKVAFSEEEEEEIMKSIGIDTEGTQECSRIDTEGTQEYPPRGNSRVTSLRELKSNLTSSLISTQINTLEEPSDFSLSLEQETGTLNKKTKKAIASVRENELVFQRTQEEREVTMQELAEAVTLNRTKELGYLIELKDTTSNKMIARSILKKYGMWEQ